MRWKLVLAAVLVEIVMLTALVWNSLRITESSLNELAGLRLAEVSELLNASISPLMAGQDYGRIHDILATSRHSEGIEYFVLSDRSGHRLLTEGWDSGQPLPSPQAEMDGRPYSGHFDTRIPITLAGQTYGHLSFGISTRFAAETRRGLLRQSIAIGTAAVVLTTLLLTLIGTWLTRHLRQLERASRAVSQGDFDVSLDIAGDDEVGRLAAAFKRMTAEIKERMDALRASEERFHGLLSISTDWYWEQDAQFRFTRQESGRPNGPQRITELIGKRRWELPTTLSAEAWAAHRADLEAHRPFHGLEYGIVKPDGSIRHLIVHGEPVFDADGKFTGYRGTAVDSTGRKRAEESLRLAASVFAEAHEGILITDADWRIVDCNPAVTLSTGFTREDLLGRDLRLHFGHDDGAPLEEALDVLAEQGHWRGEAHGRRKDGQSFPELLTASAVRDAGGAIANYMFMFTDITALKEQQQRLENLAHYDALTRLPNRVLLADRIQQALSLAQRSEELVAVAYLDLDGFKPVNDTFGHAAGDRLLIEVANRLRDCIRGGDTVARLGGDEFVLLIRAQDFGECEAAMLRVLGVLATPYHLGGQQVELSASIGVTLYPQDGSDPEVLLRHADQAMYAAKQAGRNRYHLFDSEHDRRISAHLELTLRIEAALHAGEFELFYQPKVDMRRGRVIGAEALIRWRHPERGLIPPGDFLPVIENTDFAIELGEWVIATALAQMRTWAAQGIELPVSINVAARQLQAADFVERLTALLAAHPEVPAEWVELEILETAALDDIHHVSQIIGRCQTLGISFALDDFGTGYSSLTYFKRLPARLLKIDQSFIRDMLADPEDLAIVEGVIGLARAFQRSVIAEGVETAEHGTRLLQMGCDLGQGYGIARPMPGASIPDWIAGYRPCPQWSA